MLTVGKVVVLVFSQACPDNADAVCVEMERSGANDWQQLADRLGGSILMARSY